MGPEVHLEPIPRPPGHMLVGNLLDIDAAHPIESLVELAREYGPIFELAVPGGSRFVVSGFELVASCATNRASTRSWRAG